MCSDDAEGVRVQFAEGDAILQCDHTVLHLLNGSVARPRRELLALGASVLMPSSSMRLHATTAHYTRSVLLGHFTLGRSGSNGMTIQYRSEQQWIFTIAIGSDSSLDCSLINVDLHVPRDPVKTMKIDAPRTRVTQISTTRASAYIQMVRQGVACWSRAFTRARHATAAWFVSLSADNCHGGSANTLLAKPLRCPAPATAASSVAGGWIRPI